MKIKKLIEKLKHLHMNHGNLGVFVNNGDAYNIEDVSTELDTTDVYGYKMPKKIINIDYFD